MSNMYQIENIDEYDDYNSKPHPWVRYFARNLDLIIIQSLVGNIFNKIMNFHSKYFETVIIPNYS